MTLNIKDLNLGEKQICENITIIPLINNHYPDLDILSLKNGLSMGIVKVEECEESRVNEIKVINNAVTPLILVDGEEVIGAKQNRIISKTILVNAKSTIHVPVNCSEKDRWNYTSEFEHSNHFANSKTRCLKSQYVDHIVSNDEISSSDNIYGGEVQSVVWNSIADLDDEGEVKSPTSAMSDVYTSSKKSQEEYLKYFESVPNQVGLISIVNGEFRGIEIFANPRQYKSYEEMILKSYIIDGLNKKEYLNISDKEIDNILNSITKECFNKDNTIGLGESFKISNEYGTGSILHYNDNLIHCNFFKTVKDDSKTFKDI